MTDDEIDQYLDTIKPVFSIERAEISKTLRSKADEIRYEYRQLTGSLNRPFRPEVSNQETFKIEQERKSSIRNQLEIYQIELDKLLTRQFINSKLAERDGFREEINIIRQMPRKELGDIQKQAELMNILSNKCLQLEAAVELIERNGSHLECSICLGDTSSLRGNWEDASDAISLTTKDGKILYQNDIYEHKEPFNLKENSVNSKNDELAVFHSMERLSFKEITILIDPEKFVLRVDAREKKATIPFRLLGLTKQNEISLNRQGEVFMEIANDTFSHEKIGCDKAITRISSSLREAFKTNDNPFLKGKPQFKLHIPKDKEEKRRALNRTSSYNDNIYSKEHDSTDEYLRDHDPSYNLEDPLYSPDNEN